jgi:hypothetical protein
VVIVEGAQPDVLAALGLQRDVLADEREQISRLSDVIDIRLAG